MSSRGLEVGSFRHDEECVAPTLQWGAVAVVDILGFKNATRNADNLQRVGQKLQALRGAATDVHHRICKMPGISPAGPFKVVVQVVSDTFIIGYSVDPTLLTPDSFASAKVLALRQVCVMCQLITTLALMDDSPHFAFRGCIGVGDVWLGNGVLLGEAVNEAAREHDDAKAAAIWLVPSAAEFVGTDTHGAVQLFPWDVPLRESKYTRALVLHPVWERVAGGAMTSELEANLLRTFAVDDDAVKLKFDNTRSMLATARQHFKLREPALHEHGAPTDSS